MENLKEYVIKRMGSYPLNEQSTIKTVLMYNHSETVLAADYSVNMLGKKLDEVSIHDIIKSLLLNSPFSYYYKQYYNENKKAKKRKLEFETRIKNTNIEDEDDIYNL